MKKLLAFLVVLVIFAGGSYFAYNYYYGGDDYYTKIVTEGAQDSVKSDSGEVFNQYTYEQQAYDTDGNEKNVELIETREKPLRMNAYLKLLVNERKGVISWEEVQQGDVPEQALSHLE